MRSTVRSRSAPPNSDMQPGSFKTPRFCVLRASSDSCRCHHLHRQKNDCLFLSYTRPGVATDLSILLFLTSNAVYLKNRVYFQHDRVPSNRIESESQFVYRPCPDIHEFESFICKAFRDAVVLMLPQVPDKEAYGRLGLARRVKTFMLLCQNDIGKKCSGKFNLKPFSNL